MLRKLFEIGKSCLIFQIYLEPGHLPERFVIKRMKIIFSRKILKKKTRKFIRKTLNQEIPLADLGEARATLQTPL